MTLRLAGEQFSVLRGLDGDGWLREVSPSDTLTGLKVNQQGTGRIVDFQDGGVSLLYIPDGGPVTLAANMDLANNQAQNFRAQNLTADPAVVAANEGRLVYRSDAGQKKLRVQTDAAWADVGGGPALSDTSPLAVDGSAAGAGTGTATSRNDHRHPLGPLVGELTFGTGGLLVTPALKDVDATPVANRQLAIVDGLLRSRDTAGAEGRYLSRLSLEPVTDTEVAAGAGIAQAKIAGVGADALALLAAAQTLTSKTLTAPVLNDPLLRLEDIADPASDRTRLWLADAGSEVRYWDDLVTPALRTLIATDLAQTLTNKTLTSPTVQGTVGAGTGLTMPAYTAGGLLTSSVVGNAFLPSADNQGNIGSATARWALVRAVTVTAGDLEFENRWRLTEAEKLGLEPGIALVSANGRIVHVWH